MSTVSTSRPTGPGITAANFSLAVPSNAREDGHLVITRDVPTTAPQVESYESLTRPTVFRITFGTNEDGCLEYGELIDHNPKDDTRVPLTAEATEAAAGRLREIFTKGRLGGSDDFLPGWRSTVRAFKEFNEKLYTTIVSKEAANLEEMFPLSQKSTSAATAFNLASGRSALPLQISEHIEKRKFWEQELSMYKAVHSAGKSINSLFELDPSTTLNSGVQPSESIFAFAPGHLLHIGPMGSLFMLQLQQDIESLEHPNLPELKANSGYESSKALREHLLSNAETVGALSNEYEGGNMVIEDYVERLLSIGKSALPGDCDTEMVDVEAQASAADTATKAVDTAMTEPVISETRTVAATTQGQTTTAAKTRRERRRRAKVKDNK